MMMTAEKPTKLGHDQVTREAVVLLIWVFVLSSRDLDDATRAKDHGLLS